MALARNRVANCLLAPEIFEPARRQRCIDRCRRDRPMTEPSLNRAGIMPLVRERIPATIPEHVRMRLDAESGRGGCPFEHPREAGRRERRSALGDEHKQRAFALALEAPQGAQLVALDRMRARHAVLDPARVQDRAAKVNLVPAQIDELGHSEAMAVGHQDHGRVAVAERLPRAASISVSTSPGVTCSRVRTSLFFGAAP
jgi:hypothetical protein